jgi:hypothetical protein
MATFKEAFKAARAEKGAGKTFTWNGKSYTTDLASDKKAAPKPKAKPMTSSPKPQAKPMQSSPKPQANPRNVAPKVDSTAPAMASPKPTPSVVGVVGGKKKPTVSGVATANAGASVSAKSAVTAKPKAKATGSSNAGAGASAKATVAAKKPDAMGAKIRDVLTKGYLKGSAADTRAKKSAQWYKDVDQAQVDMRMQMAADEEKRAMRRGK